MFLSPGSRARSRLLSLWKAIGSAIYYNGGNVGIGTTVPANYGQTNASPILEMRKTGGANFPFLILSTDQTANASFIGGVEWGTSGASATDKRAAMIASALTAGSSVNPSANLQFQTNQGAGLTTQMTLNAGLAVGTATDPGSGIVNVNTGYRIANAAASGNYLRGNGTNFVASTIQAGDAPTQIHLKISTFTTDAASSTSTVYYYRAVGGGGGGGGSNASGASGGGGAGAYMEGTFTGVAAGATVTITIGGGGGGGTSGGVGTGGGTTSIAATGITTLQAGGGGGGGGSSTTVSAGGAGGTIGTGSPTFSYTGAIGGTGWVTASTLQGGKGAASYFGDGGIMGVTVSGAVGVGGNATSAGAGGGGSAQAQAGGNGAGGACMIMYVL